MMLPLLLWPVAWGLGPQSQDHVDRLEKRVEALRDLECDYSTEVDLEDPESEPLRYRARLWMVRGSALRVEGYRWSFATDEKAAPPSSYRYTATPQSYTCDLRTLEPRLNFEGLPLAWIRLRAEAGHPSLPKIDPYLVPLELPARLFFDAPILLANVAPKLFFAWEPDLRAEGKSLVAERSIRELLRIRGKGRFGIASIRRRYEIDDQDRVVRCEFRFRMEEADESSPLMVWTVPKWQTVAGVSIPAEIEIAFGASHRDGDRLERRHRKIVTVAKSNAGLTIDDAPDVSGDLLLRKPESYDARIRRNPRDAAALYSRVLAHLMSGPPFRGIKGYMDVDEMILDLARAEEGNPDSDVLRTSLLFAAAAAEDFPELAKRIGPRASADVRAWILLQDPESKLEIDPARLSEMGRDVWALARIQAGGRVEFLKEELKGRSFQRQLELVALLARYNESYLWDSIPLCGVFLEKAESLEALAADPAAAGFVLHTAHEWIEHGEGEELLESEPSLRRAIRAAGAGRTGDPLVPTLLGELASKTGGEADAFFAEALKLAETSTRSASAFRATMEAASHYRKDGAKLLEIHAVFLRLVTRFGRPGQAAFVDPERSPVAILARRLCEEKRLAELYRCVRPIDWSVSGQFSGVQLALQESRLEDEFVEAAVAECRKGKDPAEHAALARLLRDALRKTEPALALLADAPKNPDLTRLRAELAALLKQYDLAIASYRELGAKLEIAEIELARKNVDAARKAVEGLDFTSDPDVAERAGALFVRLKDDAKALEAYLAAEKAGRMHNLDVGRIYQRQKNPTEAMRRFNRAVEAGENDPGQRTVDPKAETSAEKAKRNLYDQIGSRYFLDPFLQQTFAPLPKEKEARLRVLLERIDDEALDEIEAMGPDATPFLRGFADHDGIRRILLRWAEPR